MGNPLPKHRAVHDEQKQERRQAILDATWQLFQTTRYEALTMVDIAHALGLAKGTVFLYFKTKESLFLTLVEQQLTVLFTEVNTHLETLAHPSTVPEVAEVLCQSLEARPGLTRLLAILHTMLEQNIDLDTALAFKYFLLEHFQYTGTLLEQCLPFLSPGKGASLLLQSHALVIGLWHLSDPAPIVQQALQQPALHMFEVHFAPEFSTALQALLYGLERTAHKSIQEEEQAL